MSAGQLWRHGGMRQRQLQISMVSLGVRGHQGGAAGGLAVSRVSEPSTDEDQESTLKGARIEIGNG